MAQSFPFRVDQERALKARSEKWWPVFRANRASKKIAIRKVVAGFSGQSRVKKKSAIRKVVAGFRTNRASKKSAIRKSLSRFQSGMAAGFRKNFANEFGGAYALSKYLADCRDHRHVGGSSSGRRGRAHTARARLRQAGCALCQGRALRRPAPSPFHFASFLLKDVRRYVSAHSEKACPGRDPGSEPVFGMKCAPKRTLEANFRFSQNENRSKSRLQETSGDKGAWFDAVFSASL